jgi:uncharacterized membrane protein
VALDAMTDYLMDVEESHVNVGRTERWLRRRDLPGGFAAAAGAALLYRGATGHCPINERLGRNTAGNGHAAVADFGSDTRTRLSGARGIIVEDAVTINRPVSEIYRFWRNFENLPRFMQHLEAVAVREGGISHWVAKGPAGTRVEWDARIINEIENKVIAWQSLEGSMIATAGSVNFDETPRGTSLRVKFQYDPPAGKIGAAVARLLGEEPAIQVRDDLRRFKQLMETGEIPTTHGQPSGRARG